MAIYVVLELYIEIRNDDEVKDRIFSGMAFFRTRGFQSSACLMPAQACHT